MSEKKPPKQSKPLDYNYIRNTAKYREVDYPDALKLPCPYCGSQGKYHCTKETGEMLHGILADNFLLHFDRVDRWHELLDKFREVKLTEKERDLVHRAGIDFRSYLENPN